MAVLFDDRSYHGAHFTDKETEAQGLDNLPKDLQLVRSQPRTGDLRICTLYCCARKWAEKAFLELGVDRDGFPAGG